MTTNQNTQKDVLGIFCSFAALKTRNRTDLFYRCITLPSTDGWDQDMHVNETDSIPTWVNELLRHWIEHTHPSVRTRAAAIFASSDELFLC